MKIIKFFQIILLVSVVLIFGIMPVMAQTKEDLEKQIQDLNSKITDLQGQENTLSNQIKLLNSQISLTRLNIESKKSAILKLGAEADQLATEISRLEELLTTRSQLLLRRIPESYKRTTVTQIGFLVFSNDFADLISRAKYISDIEKQDAELLVQLKATQNNFTERKNLREQKKEEQQALQKQLEEANLALDRQQKQKQSLLDQTRNSEAVYQQLLSQAKAQLAGFSNFVANQGGASILSNQTSCNDWGCYYNQRDSQWGNIPLNHTQYTIASDGCLVTSMAMVITHYGHKTTPVDINSNPSNFASYYPAYLLYTVSVNGITAQRIGATIDSMLSSGNPVIVGVHAYGGTHFIVLLNGSGGNYKMHDPFIENGHEITFTDHYSLGSVFEIDKVVIN
jgi:peptidoglycan hydrolase CwlO-like protein